MKQGKSARMPWAILGSAFLVMFSTSVPMFAVPPIESILKEKLLLSYAQTSLLFTAPLVMMAALSIPGGLLADRIGFRKAAGIGVVLAAAGATLRGITSDFSMLLTFTFILGAGTALSFPNLPKLVSMWVPRERYGAATGIYTTASPVGNALAVAITLPLIYPITNTFQGTFLIWGIPPIIAAILWWALVKDPVHKNAPSEESTQLGTPFRQLLRNKSLWLVAILFLLHNFFFFNWVGWAPALMMEKGVSPDEAALIASVTMWVAIPTVLFMPRLSDRLGLRKPFLWVPSIILAFTSLWAIQINVALGWLLMAVVGAVHYSRFVTIMVLQAELMPKNVVGVASGFIISIGFIGGIIGPLIGGHILDVTGSLNQSLLVLIGVSIAMAGIALKIPETGHRAKLKEVTAHHL